MSRNWSKFCLNEHIDERGVLSVFEAFDPFYFAPKRVFFITGAWNDFLYIHRGNHAVRHKEIIICVQGEALVSLEDGSASQTLRLQQSEVLFVRPMVWIELKFRKEHTALCVLAEQPFAESEYIRDYEEWKKCVAAKT